MNQKIPHYTLYRSKRKTLAIQITREGALNVRAPKIYPKALIESFILKKISWIEKHQQKILNSKKQEVQYSSEEIGNMKKGLLLYLNERVLFLHKGTLLPAYTAIKVTKSERRWGSCNGKNSLCFSYRLYPFIHSNKRLIDAIIYHELAHLKEKNHSKKFWDIVYSLIPEYDQILSIIK